MFHSQTWTFLEVNSTRISGRYAAFILSPAESWWPSATCPLLRYVQMVASGHLLKVQNFKNLKSQFFDFFWNSWSFWSFWLFRLFWKFRGFVIFGFFWNFWNFCFFFLKDFEISEMAKFSKFWYLNKQTNGSLDLKYNFLALTG